MCRKFVTSKTLSLSLPLGLCRLARSFSKSISHTSRFAIDDEVLGLQIVVADAQLDKCSQISATCRHMPQFVIRLRAETNVPVQRFAFDIVAHEIRTIGPRTDSAMTYARGRGVGNATIVQYTGRSSAQLRPPARETPSELSADTLPQECASRAAIPFASCRPTTQRSFTCSGFDENRTRSRSPRACFDQLVRQIPVAPGAAQ